MMQNIRLKIENGFALIEFDQPDSKVNVLSSLSLTELKEIILQIKANKDLKGALILSNKPDIFIAGADIKELQNLNSVSEAKDKIKQGQEVLNALEEIPIPTVSLIDGACLGGGLELALACDYRLATFSHKVKLGLPEVRLGLIPGFGGTKRLSRLVGLRKSLEMIISGEPVSSQEAFRIGLVDELVSQNRLLEQGIELLRMRPEKRKQYRPKLKGLINILLDKTHFGRAILSSQAKKFVLKTTKGHYPAPLVAIGVVTKNYNSSVKKALEREAKAFAELVVSTISKNLISVFYLIEKYKKLKWVEAKPHSLHKCAILGAGVMGGGITQLLSFYGIAVRMKDLNYSALGRGLKQARDVYVHSLKRKKLKQHQLNLGLGLVSVTTDYSGFSNADLIIEAVVEDMQIKKQVWLELDSIAKPEAIFASNTSCLSISQMTEGIKNKARCVGMHFFNPVHRMPLVELIRTPLTSDETIATLVEFSKKIGKTPIVVKDACGFLINRILLPYLNEAGFLLDEGVDFTRIDKLCLSFGMPMGPFALMDEIGLDVGFKVALILEEHFGKRMEVAPSLKKIYAQKWLGKKSGKGFYIHQQKSKKPHREIYKFVSKSKSALSNDDILKRLLYRMVNEATMCLGEGICSSPSDVDIGMLMGTGFPAFRAGLLHYADSLGLDKIVQDLERFKDRVGLERFLPCDYLVNLAKRGKGFYK